MVKPDPLASPVYNNRPIASLESLALALGMPLNHILTVSKISQNMYRVVPQTKKDGTTRITYDAKNPLKPLQDKIVKKILRNVTFPKYLHGGIRDAELPRDQFSNARSHSQARILIMEDIRNFFPSITEQIIFDIWCKCLGFSPIVAECLTRLTTLNGNVPQGAKTSSYLTNLAFWDVESALVSRLDSMGFAYSRFVDDICVSTTETINRDTKTEVIRLIFGMLAAKGCYAKRAKHVISKSGQRMEVTGLVVNGSQPTISKPERMRIRAAVHSLYFDAKCGDISEEIYGQFRSASGRVARLMRTGHPEGLRLKEKLREINLLMLPLPTLLNSISD